jgi:hypothetical protein
MVKLKNNTKRNIWVVLDDSTKFPLQRRGYPGDSVEVTLEQAKKLADLEGYGRDFFVEFLPSAPTPVVELKPAELKRKSSKSEE